MTLSYQPLPQPRIGHVQVTLPNNEIMVCGGRIDVDVFADRNALYNPTRNIWLVVPPMQ